MNNRLDGPGGAPIFDRGARKGGKGETFRNLPRLPPGGEPGQYLMKRSTADFDAEWVWLCNEPSEYGLLATAVRSFSPITYHIMSGPEPGAYEDHGSFGATLTNPPPDVAVVDSVLGAAAGKPGGSPYYPAFGPGGTQLPAGLDVTPCNPHGQGGVTIGVLARADAGTGVQEVLVCAGEAWIGTGMNNGDRLGVSAIMPSVSHGYFGHNREVTSGLVENEWRLIICRFPDSVTALPDLRINGVNITGTTHNLSNALSDTADEFFIGGRQYGVSGRFDGSLAHAFTINGILSDSQCQVIEAAAIAEGWIKATAMISMLEYDCREWDGVSGDMPNLTAIGTDWDLPKVPSVRFQLNPPPATYEFADLSAVASVGVAAMIPSLVVAWDEFPTGSDRAEVDLFADESVGSEYYQARLRLLLLFNSGGAGRLQVVARYAANYFDGSVYQIDFTSQRTWLETSGLPASAVTIVNIDPVNGGWSCKVNGVDMTVTSAGITPAAGLASDFATVAAGRLFTGNQIEYNSEVGSSLPCQIAGMAFTHGIPSATDFDYWASYFGVTI